MTSVRRASGRVWLVAVAIGAGCAPRTYPLAEVPMSGASAELEALTRELLAWFDQWTGPGRLTLSAISFVHDLEYRGHDVAGYADSRDSSVALDVDLATPALVPTLWHELCHALDYQDGLLDGPAPDFDDLGYDLENLDDRGRRSEVLAQWCEVAPLGSTLLADAPCPADHPLAARVSRWVLDEVWTSYQPAEPAVPGVDLLTDLPLEGPLASIQVSAPLPPETTPWLSVTTEDQAGGVFVELGEPPAAREQPPLEPGFGLDGYVVQDEPPNTAAAITRVDVGRIALNDARVAVGVDGRWRPVDDSCDDGQAGVIYANAGQTWWVHGAEGVVTWSRLAP